VNFELPGPDVLSLVSEADALTAMTILVEGMGDMRGFFEAGGEVSVSGGLLRAPGISIRVTLITGQVPSAAGVGALVDTRTFRARLARLVDAAMVGDEGDSLLWVVADLRSEERRGKILSPVVQMIRPGIVALASALTSSESEAMAEAAAGLVGLGPGLTPAGDDLLCGLMLGRAYGARVPGGPGPDHGLNRAVLQAASSRTHILSRVMLERASRGVTTVGLDRLLRSLVEKQPPCPVEEADRAVLGLGATSGRDFLSGVALAWLR